MEPCARVQLLGGEVDVMDAAGLMAFVDASVGSGRRAIVANHNLNSLRLLGREPAMAALYARADRIQIDSMPLIGWGRRLGLPLERRHRLTYLDWRDAFWRLAATRGWRVFHLGCAPGVGDRALIAIARRHPGIRAASRHGFFDPDGPDNAAVLAQIAEFAPDVLFVGMGMPRQERWIVDNLERLPAAVIFPIGGALAYEAGAVATPPRWTGRIGLEWLWRFATEPRRLFARYFVEPWALAPAALRDLARRRAA